MGNKTDKGCGASGLDMSSLRLVCLVDGSEISKGDPRSLSRPPYEILVIRYGTNEFTKEGRRGSFEFSESDADSVIAEFESRGRDIVIDYEHQSLSGNEAPAAGWVNALEKSAAGLVVKVKYWTDKAAEFLKKGEYRYFSPVLQFSKASQPSASANGTDSSKLRLVSSLHSVALTNHPSLHNVQALAAHDAQVVTDEKLSGNFQLEGSGATALSTFNSENALAAHDTQVTQDEDITTNQKGKAMDNELFTMLGFSDSDQPKAKERIRELLKKETDLKAKELELAEFLKLHDAPSLDHVTGRIQSMVPASEKIALEAKIKRRDAEDVVKQAFADGKLAENRREWALKWAEKDLEAVKEWFADIPAGSVVPLENINRKDLNDAAAATEKFTDGDKKILRNLGLTDEKINTMEKGGK